MGHKKPITIYYYARKVPKNEEKSLHLLQTFCLQLLQTKSEFWKKLQTNADKSCRLCQIADKI